MNDCHHYTSTEKLEYLIDHFKNLGNRITEPRKKLASIISKFSKPFSAEDVSVKLKKTNINLTTVYRTLTSLSDSGVLSKVEFHDGITRYEFQGDSEQHHHHIICTECKKIDAIKDCFISKQEKFIEKMGYKNIFHRLEFFGICSSCS